MVREGRSRSRSQSRLKDDKEAEPHLDRSGPGLAISVHRREREVTDTVPWNPVNERRDQFVHVFERGFATSAPPEKLVASRSVSRVLVFAPLLFDHFCAVRILSFLSIAIGNRDCLSRLAIVEDTNPRSNLPRRRPELLSIASHSWSSTSLNVKQESCFKKTYIRRISSTGALVEN